MLFKLNKIDFKLGHDMFYLVITYTSGLSLAKAVP